MAHQPTFHKQPFKDKKRYLSILHLLKASGENTQFLHQGNTADRRIITGLQEISQDVVRHADYNVH